ncbi:MAG: C-GCAxxG-C-C family protein [Ruminococcus sp.]|nr:C-GCAxxG-C-C family protein [Ruminococcus sp.]MCD7728064.1 C-GCAxxG-C-C family protein [Ruminococcus sp.]
MTHADKARELFLSGYNCAQAVFCAYCDELSIDLDLAQAISSSFGGGMGRMREVCGAVSGALMVLGAKYGYTDKSEPDKKAEHYKRVQEFAKYFKEENGSIICRELLGLSKNENNDPNPSARTKEYYKKRPCAEIVYTAAKILEEKF